jgi:transposase
MTQLAWLGLRHQPSFRADAVKRNGGRVRKTMIVVLARKLLAPLEICNRWGRHQAP